MESPPAEVVTIVLVGLCGAATLTVVYATGAKAPRFTARRLILILLGLSLVTVPVPLILFWDLERGRPLVAIVGALYILAVLALGFGTPDDDGTPDDR